MPLNAMSTATIAELRKAVVTGDFAGPKNFTRGLSGTDVLARENIVNFSQRSKRQTLSVVRDSRSERCRCCIFSTRFGSSKARIAKEIRSKSWALLSTFLPTGFTVAKSISKVSIGSVAVSIKGALKEGYSTGKGGERWSFDEEDMTGRSFAGPLPSLIGPAVSADATNEGYQRLPINLDLELYRVKCLRQRDALDEAEAVLRQCIKDWPCDGRPYVGLGKILSKQERFEEARAVFEDGCQAVRGENAYIWQTWAILEEKCGDIGKARKLFDAATVAELRHAAGWHGWAMLELRQGNTKKARDLLSKGVKYCGANEYLFQTLALMEFRAGKLDEARTLLAQAVECNPKSCASWLAWALLEAEQDDSTAARHLFQRAMQASPRNRYAYQAWALFEAKHGNSEQARRLFQQGHELNPKDGVLLQAFALFEFKCSHTDTARSLFQKAALLDPNHQPIWIAWGWMEWKENNLEKARELYKRSLAVNSQSNDAARTFQAWGVLEERDGKYGEARELFKLALKVDSQNAAAWMSWAKLEEHLDNAIRAEEIRNLYLQQRTEVVDEAGWEVNLSNIFAPAIDRIKGLLNMEPQMENKDGRELSISKIKADVNGTQTDEEFNLDSFLKEKFPWKYHSQYKKFESSNSTFSSEK